MIEAELAFLAALHEATRLGVVRWDREIEDPERDIYFASLGLDTISIEYDYVSVSKDTAERLLVRVRGRGVSFQSALGTPVYEAVGEMLSLQIFGWAEGRAGALKEIRKATARIEALCRNFDSGDEPKS